MKRNPGLAKPWAAETDESTPAKPFTIFTIFSQPAWPRRPPYMLGGLSLPDPGPADGRTESPRDAHGSAAAYFPMRSSDTLLPPQTTVTTLSLVARLVMAGRVAR